MDTETSNSGWAKKQGISLLWLIIASVALIIIGGAIAYIDHKNTTNSPINSKKPFAIAANANVPMQITINTRAQGDKTGNIAVELSDGKGNFKYILYANGKPIDTTIYTPDAFYACKDFSSPCLKYPKDTSSNDFQPSDFLYTSSIIKKINTFVNYQGRQPCPVGGGTCDVWTYTINLDKKIDYMNTATKYLVAVTDIGHFGTTEITTDIAYQYENQHITVPTNYQNAPAGSK